MPNVKPPVLDEIFARYFGFGKQDLVDVEGQQIIQTGAARLAGPAPEWEWPNLVVSDEPAIETFVFPNAADYKTDGGQGTGPDQGMIEAWRPLAERMTAAVLHAAHTNGIALSGPAYLTASATPVDQVVGVPHFDDDMFTSGEGVGLVAIAGSAAGPRVATGRIGFSIANPPTQLVLPETTIDDFLRGKVAQQQGDADHIVVFPQFGQLHAGPSFDISTFDVPTLSDESADDPSDAAANAVRCLMVLRGGTQPKVT